MLGIPNDEDLVKIRSTITADALLGIRNSTSTSRSSADELDVVRLASREADYLEVCEIHQASEWDLGVRRCASLGNR